MYKYLLILKNEIKVIIKTSLIALGFIVVFHISLSSLSNFQLIKIDLLISAICSIFYLIFIRDSWWSLVKTLKDCMFFTLAVMLLTLLESGFLFFVFIGL